MQSGSGRAPVVIVGGGFAGLECARRLGQRGVPTVLIDRRNHNLFQPLLYQVATAALSPADIAEPIRKSLGRYESVSVVLGEVVRIDPSNRTVATDTGLSFEFGALVLATGSTYNYFDHPEWDQAAPGLKTLAQAQDIRQRLLMALEQAEYTTDPVARRAMLTSVIVGGGPTGVEMAGAIAELAHSAVREYRTIRASDFRILLVEAGPRLLAAFPEELSTYAERELRSLGVKVRTNTQVLKVGTDHVVLNDEELTAGTVVWGAGVKALPVPSGIDAEILAAGRLKVDGFLRVSGHQNVYALGDLAGAVDKDGKLLPALAQVAKQQGAYLGKRLARLAVTGSATESFRFKDRGNTAVIGRHAAVFDFGRWQMKGRLAWLLWALVHVYLLVSFEKRILVSIQWLWRYITRNRGARIIAERRSSERQA